MTKTAVIRARIDELDKNRFQQLCGFLGLSLSDAMTLLIRKAIREKALPKARVFNDETIQAIENSRAGIGVSKFNSFDEMMRDLNS